MPDRNLDLSAAMVRRAACAPLLQQAPPVPTNHDDHGVAFDDFALQIRLPLHEWRDAVLRDVHKDFVLAERIGELFADQTRPGAGVCATVVEKDFARHDAPSSPELCF